MNKFLVCFTAASSLLSLQARADDLPDGKGKDLILRSCVGCHKAGEIAVYRFTKDEYHTIVYRMGDRGAQATRAELDVIADYLFENFPKIEDATKINVNKATAQEIAAGLALTNEEAQAVVKYRERHGEAIYRFKSLPSRRRGTACCRATSSAATSC